MPVRNIPTPSNANADRMVTVLELFLAKMSCSTLQAILVSRVQEVVEILSKQEVNPGSLPAAPCQLTELIERSYIYLGDIFLWWKASGS